MRHAPEICLVLGVGAFVAFAATWDPAPSAEPPRLSTPTATASLPTVLITPGDAGEQ